MIYLFIFISSTYIITFSIYLCSKVFLPFRASICFTNPDYRLIRVTAPNLIRISEGFLYLDRLSPPLNILLSAY
jgi:hypothetical protein